MSLVTLQSSKTMDAAQSHSASEQVHSLLGLGSKGRDFNGDGNDDVAVLDLLADIDNQRVVVYNGPVTSSSQGQITAEVLLKQVIQSLRDW